MMKAAVQTQTIEEEYQVKPLSKIKVAVLFVLPLLAAFAGAALAVVRYGGV